MKVRCLQKFLLPKICLIMLFHKNATFMFKNISMPRTSFSLANSTLKCDVLVVVFLRGAADVLNMVVPHGEDALYVLRPTLSVPRPDDMRASPDHRTIDLDGFFGLNPLMKPLLPVWHEGHLGIVHACGAPDESRSHFKAQELMERGVGSERGPVTGWLGRHLANTRSDNRSPLRAIGLGELVPRSLYGLVNAIPLRSIFDFHLSSNPQVVAKMRVVLHSLYAGNSTLGAIGYETLEILSILQKIASPKPGGDGYPASDFGRGLQQVSALIKAQIGLEVATIDLDGWDTHFAQGVHQGIMPNLIKDLALGLSAFYADMTDQLKKLTVVVMTEFGRRAYENASLGTDHGHGGMMILMGGGVDGGKVHGDWPGLEDGQLFGPGDLAVTTDYRDVLAEVLIKRLHTPTIEDIFPGHPIQFRDVLKPRQA
jgi:uncharacterized protein (DUF1501 family)